MMDYLAKAKEVLRIEQEGIQSISDQLDESFVKLVEICLLTLNKNAKLVLSGVGKSGQIAQKMASTLSSTGSRATFLHPVEAMHGDLGVLHQDDLFIGLSYSGETDELLAVIPAVKRLNIPVASLSGSKESTLAKVSDYPVATPIEAEACPFNLAPTTTTTAMLALGDALAMVLMQARQFKLEDYGVLHPSGAIGRSVTMQVKDIMRSLEKVAVVSPACSVKEAVIAMSASNGGTALVANTDQSLAGIFTTGDLKRGVSEDPDFLTRSMDESMIKQPLTVSPELPAVKLLQIFEKRNINAIPVVDAGNSICGLVDLQDLPKFKVL